MTFSDFLEQYQSFPFKKLYSQIDSHRIKTTLMKEKLSIEDLLILLSDPAGDFLEPMAHRAAALTQRHFGKVISIFTPLYIANYCQNNCLYCSFAKPHTIVRRQLTSDEIHAEAKVISNSGIRHILVLSGESPNVTTFAYIKQSLQIIAQYFSTVSIEMYPLSGNQYQELILNGCLDSLTVYQETYNQQLYASLHQKGPKADFHFRLNTPDRAASNSIRGITIGALLGLDDYKRDLYYTALHALYLQKKYPEIELAVSFPRIRPQAGDYIPQYPVADRQLVQIITAFRLMFPNLGITLSTREAEKFRNGIMPLGITKVSAGVSTAVGGHTHNPSTTQFDIADHRTVEEMKRDIIGLGMQPIMHDWNKRLTTVSDPEPTKVCFLANVNRIAKNKMV